jgi:hypothetical protein
MSIGTLFTLFVTPAVYSFIARDHSKDRAKTAGPDLAGPPHAEPRAAE